MRSLHAPSSHAHSLNLGFVLAAWVVILFAHISVAFAQAPATQAEGPATQAKGPASPSRKTAPTPPVPPFSVALLSFEDQRRIAGEDWLGRFLRESLTLIFSQVPQVSVHDPDTAPLWRAQLGLRGTDPPDRAALQQLGARVVIVGTTQQVLTLVNLKWRAVGLEGDFLPEGIASRRIHMHQDSPGAVVKALAKTLGDALIPDVPLHLPPAPKDWAQVRGLYGLLQQPMESDDRAARPRRIARLESYLTHPQLAPRAHEALARLHVEQSMLHMPEGRPRSEGLRRALAHVTAARAASPRNTWLQALNGEILFFMRKDHQARTEASIARIRNPLNGLAYVVLGLVSGLSSGESTEQLKRAFSVNPFLRAGDRPPGSPPYQGGILEPRFTQWSRLQAERIRVARPDYKSILAKAIAQFELERWDAAEAQFREAGRLEEDDFTPWLYLNRILIETGRSELAVQPLSKLAQEFPDEIEIRFHLGLALERSGENAASLKAFQRLKREKPNDPEILFHLATGQSFEGSWNRARATLERLLLLDRNHLEGWLLLGRVSEHLKDQKTAVRAYREVLLIKPGNQEAQRRLLNLKESEKPAS